MKVYGKLERAQIEHVGALPSASVDKAKGRVVYLTTDDRYYISDGSSWIKAMPDVTTTKGDLTSFSTIPARLGVGSDGTVLTADSTQTTGLRWATSATAPDQSYEISNLSLAASVAGNALTIAVKDKGGSDPSGGSVVKVGTRNSTLTNGTYNQRSISSALSITVSSGSTLGHASATAHYIYVYLIDNAGTLELAVSSTSYEDHSIISTTAEGGAGAADSNATIYSTTARSNVGIRLIGRMLSTQTTAGTWAAVPSEIKLTPFKRIPTVCKYYNASGTSLTDTANRFADFPTKDWCTNNNVLGAGGGSQATYTNTWRYVADETAYYDVEVSWVLTAGSTASTRFRSIACVDGAETAFLTEDTKTLTSGVDYYYYGKNRVYCTAGQAISILYFKSGAAVSPENGGTGRYTTVNITKVK